MNERVIALAESLNQELNSHPDVVLLKSKEKELNDSFEVYTLSKAKDEALEVYINNKELYGEDSSITLESLTKLKDAKEKLNNHPLVKEYLSNYNKVRDLYMDINDIVLGDLLGENKVCR